MQDDFQGNFWSGKAGLIWNMSSPFPPRALSVFFLRLLHVTPPMLFQYSRSQARVKEEGFDGCQSQSNPATLIVIDYMSDFDVDQAFRVHSFDWQK